MVRQSRAKKPNITITAEDKILNELKAWSQSRGLSMNSLINEILAKNTSFFKYVEAHECMIIPSTIFSHIIKLLPDKALTDLSNQSTHEIIQSIFAHNNIPYTMESMIRFYFEGIGLWSGMYTIFKHYTDMGIINLVFEHKYGIKWSKVLSHTVSDLIEKMLNQSSTSKIHPNTVIVQVKEK
ncbi:MAG TPA: hypothetical protein VLT10_00420 [Verrucomicrobiae bacterium]|nr:hypothetical protein [Verrucomicrobiae bacterium]